MCRAGDASHVVLNPPVSVHVMRRFPGQGAMLGLARAYLVHVPVRYSEAGASAGRGGLLMVRPER
jgi:hypothetical protein